MPVCGNWQQKQGGVAQFLSGGGEFPGASDHAGTTECPLPGRGVGWCRENLAGHGFLLIAPSLTIRCERFFGLTAVWAHPHQAHFQTLKEVAHKCLLDGSVDHVICLHMAKWHCIPCTPIEQRAHQHHDGWCAQCRCLWLASPAADMQTVAAWGQGGVPGRPKQWARSSIVYSPSAAPLGCCCSQWALLRTTTARSGHQQLQPEGMTTAIQDPTTTLVLTHSLANTIEPPCDITMAINFHLQGALEWLWQASPAASAPVSQCSMPRREPPSVALGALPPTKENEDPLRPKIDGLSHPCLNGNPHTDAFVGSHGQPHQVTPPESLMLFTPCSSPPCQRHWRQPVCICSPRVIPATLLDKLLPLQEKMNTTLEQLLTVRSSRDLHCKELDLNMELAVHLNEVQTTEAIRQAKVHGATTAYTLQHAHKENVLVLEHQEMEEERWACKAFMEAFRAAIGACPPKNQGALLYPLQLLTSDVPLVALLGMLATTQLWAMADGELAPTVPIPRVLEMPAPPTGTKCQCYSLDQGVPAPRQEEEETVEPDYTLKECPHQKWKEGRLVAKALEEPHCKALYKESEVVRMARQAYYKTHQPYFKQEEPDDLSSMFQQMATSVNLLGTKIHEVQENWGGSSDLQAANQLAKSSSKDIHFFRIVAPTDLPKNNGLKGHPLTQGPAMVEWPTLLPMVWERRPKWRDGGKPFVDYALPPGPHLHLLPWIFHECRCHASAHSVLQFHSSQPQWQQGEISPRLWGRWQWQWWLWICIGRRLYCPIISTSHPVVASSTLYIGVHTRAGLFCQGPSANWTVASFQQCWSLLITCYVQLHSMQNCSVLCWHFIMNLCYVNKW